MPKDEVRMRPHDGDVMAFVDAVPDDRRRADALVLLDLMSRVTGEPARMWGPSIIGFGSYHYVYATGREGDAPVAGFSPRKAATTVYLVEGFQKHAELLERLGPHTTGQSCLYLKRLDGVDLGVLEELVRDSYVAATSHAPPD